MTNSLHISNTKVVLHYFPIPRYHTRMRGKNLGGGGWGVAVDIETWYHHTAMLYVKIYHYNVDNYYVPLYSKTHPPPPKKKKKKKKLLAEYCKSGQIS